MTAKMNQARLRLIKSDDFDLCSSYNFSAASPRGSLVRPHSISLTEDGARPTIVPISARVSPVERRSDMRDAHVLMGRSLRVPVDRCQRPPVTALRDNRGMPRPSEMPDNLDTIGARVRWWRRYRRHSVQKFAKMCGMAPSTLTDLELNRTQKGKSLHLIAARLRLHANYLETGKGEPEIDFVQGPSEDGDWPLPAVQKQRLDDLNMIERAYAENKLLEALADIDAERRKSKKAS